MGELRFKRKLGILIYMVKYINNLYMHDVYTYNVCYFVHITY